jgi:hypothetical protein
MHSSTTVGQPQVPSHPADCFVAGRSRPPMRAPGVTWPRPRQRPGRGTGFRVLCIDDEPQVLKYLEELFALNGFDVDVALDGATGRSRWRTGTTGWSSIWCSSLSCRASM